MPFLTDRIQHTQRKALEQRALADENVVQSPESTARRLTGLPNARFQFDFETIEHELRSHIIGQDHVIGLLVQYMKTICVDIGDPRKPLASILFTGPTGVGKTETVRLLARALYGDADAFCRIDMNTLAQEHYSAALTGAPPGYVGSKEGTTILDQDKIEGSRNLPGIVLFDELEKASNEVILALLNVFDNGLLTVASGERTISFRNAIVFMTSNLGVDELEKLRTRRGLIPGSRRKVENAEARDAMLDVLLSRFPPEFVNRIDQIETFNWIEANQLPQIVAVEIEKLNLRLRKHNCRLELEPEVTTFLAQQSYDARFGAREIRRTIRKHLEFPLAEYLLKNRDQAELRSGEVYIVARMNNTRVVFNNKR